MTTQQSVRGPVSHKLIFHDRGSLLWAECSCRNTDENGWLWLEPYLLLRGMKRREVVRADFTKHLMTVQP